MSRQAIRSEETKRAILGAAGQLFSERGFEAVTMREIAKAAGCSHTTIYIYFTDKEALLHQLSMEPLQALQEQMATVLQSEALSGEDKLRQMSRVFLRFCLTHRSMYTTLFKAKASRVDEATPALEVQAMRNHLFGMLQQAVQKALPPGQTDERLLAYARIHFFLVHGILDLYANADEPLDRLMERLTPTFDLAVEVMLAGFKQTASPGGNLP
jgi:AcrR family transcriptional regulator